MMERIEPTIEEIVVALRETTRGVGRSPPLTMAHGRGVHDWPWHVAASNGNRGLGPGRTGVADATHETVPTEIADLRDAEIERLLADNPGCKERIISLLEVIEHEQARNAVAAADTVAAGMDREAILSDAKASFDAELRPVLLVVQRLLEKQHQLRPVGESAGMSHELDGRDEAPKWRTPAASAGVTQLANLRQRIARAFDAMYVRSVSEISSRRRDRDRIPNDR